MGARSARRRGGGDRGRRDHPCRLEPAAEPWGRAGGGTLSALLVFVGGGTGALLRWWLGSLVKAPGGTLLVNLLGCLLMGLLAGWLLRSGGNEPGRLLLGVGLLGGFTTMSAFALESVELWTRSPMTALVYAGATIAGSLGALALGLTLAR